jgi:hypothetical protein
MDSKNQANTKDASTQQLEEIISKAVVDWVSSNATKSSTTDDNPENDICYDK